MAATAGVTESDDLTHITRIHEVQGHPTTVRRSGSGSTVVFLHGAFLPTEWLEFHERLARTHDLVAPVLPGYPEGNPPSWMRGIDDVVLHVRALLDDLDVRRFHLIGYDLGAWVAADFSAHHPDRVRSLTAIAPLGLRVPEAPPMEWMAADPLRVVDALFNGEPGAHANMFPPPSDIPGFVRAYGENGVTARLIWERRYDVRLERRLSHCAVPAHVITPVDDRVVPPVHARRWAEALMDATLTELDDVGHALLVQAPERVADSVLTFIDRIDATTGDQ